MILVRGVTGHCSDVNLVGSTQLGTGPVFCGILLLVRERRESVVGNTQGSSYKNTGSFETLLRGGVDRPELLGGSSESTMLHLFAGAKVALEAVELATDESVAGEFGTDTELQLITQMKIPGCVIGKRFVFHVGIVANCIHSFSPK